MTDVYMKEVGSRIRALRVEFDINQQTLANAVFIAQNTLSQYENGIALPGLEVVVRLAIALNTTTDFLLGLEDEFGNKTKKTPLF